MKMNNIYKILISLCAIALIAMMFIVVLLEIEGGSIDEHVQQTNCLQCNNIRQMHYNRLDQLRVGEINHKQYRDSVYTDFENYMIRNNN